MCMLHDIKIYHCKKSTIRESIVQCLYFPFQNTEEKKNKIKILSQMEIKFNRKFTLRNTSENTVDFQGTFTVIF